MTARKRHPMQGPAAEPTGFEAFRESYDDALRLNDYTLDVLKMALAYVEAKQGLNTDLLRRLDIEPTDRLPALVHQLKSTIASKDPASTSTRESGPVPSITISEAAAYLKALLEQKPR